jgi:hypothetical protein
MNLKIRGIGNMVLSDTGVPIDLGETFSTWLNIDPSGVKNRSATDIYLASESGKRVEELQSRSVWDLNPTIAPNFNVVPKGEKINRSPSHKMEKNPIRFPSKWPFEWRESEIPRSLGKILSDRYAAIPGLSDYDYDFKLVFVTEDDQRENKFKAVFSLEVPALDKSDFVRVWNEAIKIYESEFNYLKSKSKPGSKQRRELMNFYKIARIHLER